MKSPVCLVLMIGLSGAMTTVEAMVCQNDGVNGTAPTVVPNDNNLGTALACGDAARAEANRSLALGDGAEGRSIDAIAIGSGAVVNNTAGDGIAIGASTIVSMTNGITIGNDSAAGGENSTSIGAGTNAIGTSSVALGHDSLAGSARSTAIGWKARSSKVNAIVLGSVIGVNDAITYADVGIGTPSPDTALHVTRSNGTATVLVEETEAIVEPRTLFTLANPGNTKFEIINTDAANTWAFTNSGTDFRISLQNSGVVEFRVDNNGNAFLEGLLQENSDRDAKTAITDVNSDAILDRVSSLPIKNWSYKDDPATRHIGPMAQDFHAAFGTGPNETSLATMDVGGVAIASIQALALKNRQLEAEVAELKTALDSLRTLEQEVAQLRLLLKDMAPRVAQN